MLTYSYVHVSIIILYIQLPFAQCVFAECSLNCMHLKIIKYMGKKLVNTEKFKYMHISMIVTQLLQIWQHQLSKYRVYVQCSKMYAFFKVCMRTRTHTHTRAYIYIYIYIIHVGGMPKFELSVSLVSYQVFKSTIQNGNGAFNFVLLFVPVCSL